jgi:hypothetical protein
MMVLSQWTAAASSSVEAGGSGFLSRRADVAVEDRGDAARGGVRGKNGAPSRVVRGRMPRQRKKGHQMLAPVATGGVFSPFLVKSAGDLGDKNRDLFRKVVGEVYFDKFR